MREKELGDMKVDADWFGEVCRGSALWPRYSGIDVKGTSPEEDWSLRFPRQASRQSGSQAEGDDPVTIPQNWLRCYLARQ